MTRFRIPFNLRSPSITIPHQTYSTSSSPTQIPHPFPWHPSTSPPRLHHLTQKKPLITKLTTKLRDHFLLKTSIERAQRHLQSRSTTDPELSRRGLVGRIGNGSKEILYPFPERFLNDCENVVKQFVEGVNNGNKELEKYCTPLFWSQLLPYLTSPSNSKPIIKFTSNKLSSKITKIHFTYGPYPPNPSTHATQNWFSNFTLIVPKDAELFSDHERQMEVYNDAMRAGVYLRVFVEVNDPGGIGFEVFDDGNKVFSDMKQTLNLQFMSPHFSPEDTIHVENKYEDGSVGLCWDWKIADWDDLVEVQRGEQDTDVVIKRRM